MEEVITVIVTDNKGEVFDHFVARNRDGIEYALTMFFQQITGHDDLAVAAGMTQFRSFAVDEHGVIADHEFEIGDYGYRISRVPLY